MTWSSVTEGRRGRHGCRPRRDRGSVTAETAVAVPALVLVAAALVFLVGVVGAHIRCADAAREAVRAAARGDNSQAVQGIAAQVAPSGATLRLTTGDTVRVTVTAQVRAPGFLAELLPEMSVAASAVALPEAGAMPGGASR